MQLVGFTSWRRHVLAIALPQWKLLRDGETWLVGEKW